MNAIGKVFVILVTMVLLYLVPTYYTYQRHDDMSNMLVQKATTTFVDAVRDKGYITPQMYNDFTRDVQSTGNTYEIVMTHEKKKYDPVYNSAGVFGNSVNVNYDMYYGDDILPIMFPNNSTAIDSDSRRYKLNTGDFFYVKIINTNRTNAAIVQDMLNGKIAESNIRILITYGGMVYNEDY